MMILDDLPSCFLKDYESGLGLAPPYKSIVTAIEALGDCDEMIVSGDRETGHDGKHFYLATRDLETLRKDINRTSRHGQSAARSVNYASTYNLLATKLGKPVIPVNFGRHPSRHRFTDELLHGKGSLSARDQDAVLDVLLNNAGTIAKNKAKRLTSLKESIELVTLDALIEHYAEMLSRKAQESQWQRFLSENAFILSLAFGYPVLRVQDQASVGGHRLSGDGTKIADFLVKNSMTDNSALVEVKTPQTPLLTSRPFRGGVYSPSGALVAAVNQVLDQKYHFEREIARIKVNSHIYDIESYAVRSCLVIGKVPSHDDKKKSFELYRGNSKNVDIITFDELFAKVQQLRELLTSPSHAKPTNIETIEPPF